jgi:pyruvate kinase
MYLKKTKIVATLGPATSSPEAIKKMALAGVNIFRLNTSHSDPSQLKGLIGHIRRTEQELDHFLGVLLDLQGPKIRIGKFENGFIEIRRGDLLDFTTEEVLGNEKVVPVQYKKFHQDVKVGNRILLDDGNLSVLVQKIEGKRVTVEVMNGGTLSNHKGLNLPEASISASPITKKDKMDLAAGLECGIDFVALSFVKGAEEIRALRRMIQKEGQQVEIIAKVERHEAIKNLDQIIKEADGVMVARGDMGVEIPFEQVPLVQKQILDKASLVGKPVIIATQMLESMIHSHRATRAEISDMANAVGYYADALMLSAETAVGSYPVEAIEAMAKTAIATEDYQFHNHKILPWRSLSSDIAPVTHGITYAANQLGEVLGATAIIAFTESGETVKHVAKPRPNIPIYAFTPNINVARRLCIVRGVTSFWMRRAVDLKEPLKFIFNILKKKKLIKKGDRVIITSGIPLRKSGSTNMIRVETVR